MHRHLPLLRRRLGIRASPTDYDARALSTAIAAVRALSYTPLRPPPPSPPPLPHRRASSPIPPTSDAGFDSSYSSMTKDDGFSLLTSLWIDSFRRPDRTVTDLSTHLARAELWIIAFQKACADDTGSYVSRSAISKSALEDLLSLRDAVLDGRFRWGSRLEFFIRSPRDRLDIASLSKRKLKLLLTTTQPAPFQDRIVQEVLLMILEPLYEARFSQKSFAFRAGRTAHTVIRTIRRSFAGYLWYIKGDLSTIMDGLKVGMVINALMRDVRDKRVVDLIKSALVTPVITTAPSDEPVMKKKKRKYQKKRVLAEDEPKPDPYWLQTFFGFAPEEAEKLPSWGHCGGLSPLLANVCLDELDRFMEAKIKDFYCPSKSDVIWNDDGGREGEHFVARVRADEWAGQDAEDGLRAVRRARVDRRARAEGGRGGPAEGADRVRGPDVRSEARQREPPDRAHHEGDHVLGPRALPPRRVPDAAVHRVGRADHQREGRRDALVGHGESQTVRPPVPEAWVLEGRQGPGPATVLSDVPRDAGAHKRANEQAFVDDGGVVSLRGQPEEDCEFLLVHHPGVAREAVRGEVQAEVAREGLQDCVEEFE
ncbi:hypothetical protein QJS10_CPB11g00202 [Acorus calamus]|uniref:Domain X domain-containing protein n=1 Tax=Acorus calamus TaxID=4465 RepID=A0AAV9DUZ0_ACOCL|nr:hypothetical protein QJS10_CPB11g00202 [Acorus calamus]